MQRVCDSAITAAGLQRRSSASRLSGLAMLDAIFSGELSSSPSKDTADMLAIHIAPGVAMR